ncbi:hypothetical protein CF326_g6277 [Tilletia indica]|nr:hypothetical protein CF326_g6277 [Tilletia indica]
MTRVGHPDLFRDSGPSRKRTRIHGPDVDLCARLAELDGLFEERSERVRGEALTARNRKPRVYPPGVPSATSLMRKHVPSSNARDVFRSGYHYLASRGVAAWESRRTGEDRGAAFCAAVLAQHEENDLLGGAELDIDDVEEEDAGIPGEDEWAERDENHSRDAAMELLQRHDLRRYHEEVEDGLE